MSVVARGAKNAFRNPLRTGAVVLILAIGIGLALSMLVAKQAVDARISDLKAQIGTTLVVNPAGAQGREGGGEPLKTDDITKIKNIAHVSSVATSVNFMLQTEGQEQNGFMKFGGGGGNAGTTNLQSSIDAGTLGRRFNSESSNTTSQATSTDVHLPIRGIGSNDNVNEAGQALKITDGRGLNASDTTSALVGKDLATKNNLKVGSSFTAYGTTFTVVGIFDQGTKFANDSVVMPLAKAQELSGQTGEVGSALVSVDSLENLDATSTAIKNTLGTDKVDVTSPEQNVQTAIDSLKSVQQVSLIGFFAALAAAAVITFLVMLVIVRERRREIGVLKAIGASNRTIVSQFIVEAVVLVALAGVLGLGVTLLSSNGIANALVSNTSNSNSQTENGTRSGGGPRMIRIDAGGNQLKRATDLVGQVTATVGPLTLLWGALATIGIAIVGSAVPAWLIAKVRPAEVMRGE